MEPDYVKLKVIKPALAGYINEAHILLGRSPLPDEEAVHDIRVLMKRARATVRLLDLQISDELFVKEHDTYREIGRMMASNRETSVQRKTLKLLKKENKDLFAKLEENEIVKGLLEKSESPNDESEKLKIEKVNIIAGKAAARLRFYSFDKLNPQMLLKQLEKTYLVAAENYLKCRINPKPDAIHEFRKKSKDFLYQLYFFRPLNPAIIKDLEKKLDIITQNLGKCNDLSQLIRLLDYKYGSPDNIDTINELVAVIRNKQDEYLLKIWPLSYKIFCPGQKLVNVLGFKLLII
jgi:CHAD domain-containing protein